MRFRVMGSLAAVFLASCGAAVPPRPSPSPAPSNPGLATGLEAARLAAAATTGVRGVLRISASFPRAGGRAEFWSVTVAAPGGGRLVEIQGRRVVESRHDQDGFSRAVALSRLRFDTSDAVRRVSQLSRVRAQGYEVAVAPLTFDMTSEQFPPGVRGRAVWQIYVTADGGTKLIETVWVSAVTGEIVEPR